MHSSRMHTGRSLTVCCSLLPGGWGWKGGCFPAGGVCLDPGDLPGPGGFSLPGGGVCLVPGGFSLPGGGVRLVPGGFSLLEGVCLARGACLETPPVDRITDTCKNITLATTSLRPVMTLMQKGHSHYLSKAGTEQLC